MSNEQEKERTCTMVLAHYSPPSPPFRRLIAAARSSQGIRRRRLDGAVNTNNRQERKYAYAADIVTARPCSPASSRIRPSTMARVSPSATLPNGWLLKPKKSQLKGLIGSTTVSAYSDEEDSNHRILFSYHHLPIVDTRHFNAFSSWWSASGGL
jgi:hypothetical protein